MEKQGTQIMGKVLPLMTKIEGMLRNRISLPIKKYLPQYMIDEVESTMMNLKGIETTWKAVIEGKAKNVDPEYGFEKAMNIASLATQLVSDFQTMLNVAEKQAKA